MQTKVTKRSSSGQLAALEQRAKTAHSELEHSLGVACGRAWLLGEALEALKAACQHGQFRASLKRIGIDPMTASRCRRIFAGYTLEAACELQSVRAAMRELAPAQEPNVSRVLHLNGGNGTATGSHGPDLSIDDEALAAAATHVLQAEIAGAWERIAAGKGRPGTKWELSDLEFVSLWDGGVEPVVREAVQKIRGAA